MWIEELQLENIKCFESLTLKLGENGKPYPWVTLLGENGAGKTTVLQAMGLLLAGQFGIAFPWKNGWRNEKASTTGLLQIDLTVHGGPAELDPPSGRNSPIRIGALGIPGFTSVGTHIASDESKFLKETLHADSAVGWFGVGYGAFRRLSKEGNFSSKRPEFNRLENYNALFEEQSLDTFNAWMMYLDHIILKNGDERDKRHLAITKSVIDSLLPSGTSVIGAEPDGKIYFSTPNGKRPSTSLSDGYRSIIALAGDLIWRMIQAFPDSESPNHEQGVALIDELDIHLHPKWQRSIAEVLRTTFPNLQFIVATHSPIVAAGAGSDAVTYGFYQQEGKVVVERVDHLWAKSVDDILRSPAFGLVSEFSVETQAQIDKYFELRRKKKLNSEEQQELEGTYPYVREALGPGMGPSDMQLEIEALLKEKFG